MAKEKKFSLINCNHFKQIDLDNTQKELLTKYFNVKYKDVIYKTSSKVYENEKKSEESKSKYAIPMRNNSFSSLEISSKLSIGIDNCLDIINAEWSKNNNCIHLNGIQIYVITEALGYIAADRLDELSETEEKLDKYTYNGGPVNRQTLLDFKDSIIKELQELSVLEQTFRNIIGLGIYKKLEDNFSSLNVAAMVSVCEKRYKRENIDEDTICQ